MTQTSQAHGCVAGGADALTVTPVAVEVELWALAGFV
jgi:hypothetical protein